MLQTLNIEDGTKLAYRVENGAGSGRITLIHALAMDHSFWNPLVDALKPHYGQILTYDCRGHGESTMTKERFSLQLFADDLKALLDHLGWEASHVAGASMGGCVALAFASSYASTVERLGLIDTTAWYGPDAVEKWEARGNKAVSEGLHSLLAFQIDRWFTRDFTDANKAEVERLTKIFLANDVVAYKKTCSMLGLADERAALQDIKASASIIVGEEDYATPVSMSEALQEALPDAKLTIVPGTRHFTPVEAPLRVAEALAFN